MVKINVNDIVDLSEDEKIYFNYQINKNEDFIMTPHSWACFVGDIEEFASKCLYMKGANFKKVINKLRLKNYISMIETKEEYDKFKTEGWPEWDERSRRGHSIMFKVLTFTIHLRKYEKLVREVTKDIFSRASISWNEAFSLIGVAAAHEFQATHERLFTKLSFKGGFSEIDARSYLSNLEKKDLISYDQGLYECCVANIPSEACDIYNGLILETLGRNKQNQKNIEKETNLENDSFCDISKDKHH